MRLRLASAGLNCPPSGRAVGVAVAALTRAGAARTEIQDGVQAPHPEMPAWLPPAFTAPCRKPQTDASLVGNRRAVRKLAKYGDFPGFLTDGHEGRITRVSV